MSAVPKLRHGGARVGAGRPVGPRPRVRHLPRPPHNRAHPVHLTIRCVRGAPNLRAFLPAREIGLALHALKSRGRRVTEFSIQHNHLHLIVEATDRRELIRVARGIAIAVAKRVNRVARRRGRVFADRYHTRPLIHGRTMRAALLYVLANHKKHDSCRADIDPLSSARWFTGWRRPVPAPTTPCPVSSPQTAIGTTFWRDFGLIDPLEFPKSMPPGVHVDHFSTRNGGWH